MALGRVFLGHWEQGGSGPQAVFHYMVPKEKSNYKVALLSPGRRRREWLFRTLDRVSRKDRDRSRERSHPSADSRGGNQLKPVDRRDVKPVDKTS
jgi:hypothetical protein